MEETVGRCCTWESLTSCRNREMCGVTFPSPPLRPLQEYTNTKAMESTLKSLKYSLKKSFRKQSTVSDISTAVSSMPPPHYAKRFLDFMKQIFQ
eukprot:symbB.v1.2.034765.t1/scaffold4548.1/size38217/2